MDLSIIIVNYKTAQFVIDCIHSVHTETKIINYEIIVVDNDSNDNSKSLILAAHPNVIWMEMGYNSGFARANNVGIKRATGELILLLNGDTLITENALNQTVNLMKENPQAVACGVQLLNPDGTHQISGAHTIKGGLNILLTIPYIGNVVRYWGYRLKSKIPSVQNIQAAKIEVDWIIGAFIMVRKNFLEKSGLLDEDFFMYSEEIEWCHRLKKQGQLYLFSEPKVIHIGGGSSSLTFGMSSWDNSYDVWSRKAAQIMLSGLVRVRKEFGIFWFLVIYFFYITGVPVFFFGYVIQKIFFTKKIKYTWHHVKGYAKNVWTISKYFLRIFLNNPFFYKLKNR
jgi:GT2 family glycosyltransferase